MDRPEQVKLIQLSATIRRHPTAAPPSVKTINKTFIIFLQANKEESSRDLFK